MSTKSLTGLLFAVLLLGIANNAHADWLYGESPVKVTASINYGGTPHTVYVSPFDVQNVTTEQSFIAFCGDFNTTLPPAWSGPPASPGVEYDTYSFLDWGGYSEPTQELISNLFGYTYAATFDGDTILNSVYAQAFQLALWSVIHETDEDNLTNILAGNFKVTNLNSTSEVVTTTNAWLSALYADDIEAAWLAIGFGDYIDYDLYVYAPANGVTSQVLISVSGPPGSETPEPATLAILGCGLAGLGLVRARRRK